MLSVRIALFILKRSHCIASVLQLTNSAIWLFRALKRIEIRKSIVARRLFIIMNVKVATRAQHQGK